MSESTELLREARNRLYRPGHDSAFKEDTLCQRIDAHLASQPEAAQEPVAWMWRCKPYCAWPEWNVSIKRPADSGTDGIHKRTENYEDYPLYTRPAAQDGWRLVPVDPTFEIRKCLEGKIGIQWLDGWQDALASAPQPKGCERE